MDQHVSREHEVCSKKNITPKQHQTSRHAYICAGGPDKMAAPIWINYWLKADDDGFLKLTYSDMYKCIFYGKSHGIISPSRSSR